MVMFSIAKNKDRDDYTLMQVKDGVTTYALISTSKEMKQLTEFKDLLLVKNIS